MKKSIVKRSLLAGTAFVALTGSATMAVAQDDTAVAEPATANAEAQAEVDTQYEPAQSAGYSPNDPIIVQARRRDEVLQDVPISIAVLSQQDVENANIVNSSDLAASVPGLMSNERFGSDNSSFAIRGFTQELRTTPSVGVYFAEVVAPRGGTSTTSGDGAGPGAFFDLQNVQVLRGPQGTLFGRNTTGGAVLLSPQRPTDEFEGFIEGTVGSYDQRRIQGVLNVPASDNLRFRFGVDHNKRDGYIDNISPVGPSDFGDVDYTAVRGSMLFDITPDIENYTLVNYTKSENNGTPSQLFTCDPTPTNPSVVGQMCPASLPANPDFYDIQNSVPDPRSEIEQWQAINTTTVHINDNLRLKNILSYAELETTLVSLDLGTDLNVDDVNNSILSGAPLTVAPDASPFRYIIQQSGAVPGIPTVDQRTFVEELQLQADAFDGRLDIQAGLYYEHSTPDGEQGGQSAGNILCDLGTLGANPANFRCADTNYIVGRASGLPQPTATAFFRGGVNRAIGSTEFENKAIYAQGIFDVTDAISLTVGARYTWDKTIGKIQNVQYYFNPSGNTGAPDGIVFNNAGTADDLVAPTAIVCTDPSLTYAGDPENCNLTIKNKSDAPTWLVGLDYQPINDILLYAKYARGYRQGGVTIASVAGGYTYEPEKVDSFELGAKTSFGGPFPGTFNIAGFYNELSDQQVQLGLLPAGGVGTTAIVNVGASTIYGVEADLRAELFEGFNIGASYTYLNTKYEEVVDPLVAGDPACGGRSSFNGTCINGGTVAAVEGQPTPFSPKHQLSLTAAYRLPFSEQYGDFVISTTYNYTDDYLAVMPVSTPFAKIPSYDTVNLNLNWDRVMGSDFDARAYVTNLFDKEYYTYVAGQYNSSGFEYRQLGRPFMTGLALRYNFGGAE